MEDCVLLTVAILHVQCISSVKKAITKNYCLATVMADCTNPVYMCIFIHKHSLCAIFHCRPQLGYISI